MEETLIVILRFIFLFAVFVLLYFVFASIWDINPTDIKDFNMKGAISSLLIIFVSFIGFKIIDG